MYEDVTKPPLQASEDASRFQLRNRAGVTAEILEQAPRADILKFRPACIRIPSRSRILATTEGTYRFSTAYICIRHIHAGTYKYVYRHRHTGIYIYIYIMIQCDHLQSVQDGCVR